MCHIICMRFYILIFRLKSITRTPVHECTMTVLNTVYAMPVYTSTLFALKKISVED